MIKRATLTLLLFPMSIFAMGQEFTNEITLPSKQYLMKGIKNEIYTQTFLKQWRPYDDFVRYGGNAGYAEAGRLEKKAIIDNAQSGDTIKVDLINADKFETASSNISTIAAGEAGVGNKEVVVQFLGDSYTRGNYFKYAFLESGYVPNVKLVGIITIPEYDNQAYEGRGGWTLERYFSTNTKSEYFCNPYYQPTGEYKFWGNTSFWRNAVGLNNDPTGSQPLRYNCGNYDTKRFSGDGKLINPTDNDMMYDNDIESFVVWSNKRWKKIDKPKEWDFNYSKYLEMWELESPEFLVVMLGLNDFRDKEYPLDFAKWNSLMERMLKSYRAAVPNGRLALCTPCTSCGVLDNATNQFTTLQNAKMWEARKNIIDTFDNREDEGIYVVDASATIDNENGYNMNDGIQIGNPHPYPNYPALGVPIAAFVQYYREK